MLANEYRSELGSGGVLSAGKLDAAILPCISRTAVLDAIVIGLAEFARRAECKSIKNEKGITNRLCKILSGHKLLYFHHEGMQDEESGTSASVDVEAVALTETVFEARSYAREETLMSIEAKRLPSPPPKAREREYLIGNKKRGGGVERFKLGIHGRKCAAWTMLAYIQQQDFRFWRNEVNNWIDDLSQNGEPSGFWDLTEKVEVIAEDMTVMRGRSHHKRQSDGQNDKIEIAHLWVSLTN